MKKIVMVLAFSLFSAASAFAQSGTISLARARTIALATVPNHGAVKSEKLKTKDGVQFYEFDIETAGAGHREVRVDARTGTVIADKHEDDLIGGTAKKAENAAKKVGHEANKAVDKVTNNKTLNAADYRVTENQARRIALRRHGGSNARVEKIWLDREDGVVVWKVKLETNGKPDDHELLVNAQTGAIIEHKH